MGLNLIFSSFFDALGQFSDPRFRRVLFIGIALTLALLIGATAGLVYLVDWLIGDSLNVPLVGEITWFDDILSFSSLLLMLVLSVFLMVPVASAITSLFLEDVAQAVEDEHYPRLPEAQGLPFADALRDTINFLGVIVAANLLALLLYVLLPVANILIFWALNGFLLGREYFTLVAARRVGRQRAKELRRDHAGTIWVAGTLMAMPLSIPLLNLVIPILGAATFTHLYHRLTAAQAPGQRS
ncbi:MAG: EI24 domain-containing protein [Rhodobacteraceae bacterium]|nr:EI24 domain-containing protein [Paracoccaceae bacterium]